MPLTLSICALDWEFRSPNNYQIRRGVEAAITIMDNVKRTLRTLA